MWLGIYTSATRPSTCGAGSTASTRDLEPGLTSTEKAELAGAKKGVSEMGGAGVAPSGSGAQQAEGVEHLQIRGPVITDSIRMCQLLVGLPSVTVLGVVDLYPPAPRGAMPRPL